LKLTGPVFDIKIRNNSLPLKAETNSKNIFDDEQPECAKVIKRANKVETIDLPSYDEPSLAMNSVYQTNSGKFFALLTSVTPLIYGDNEPIDYVRTHLGYFENKTRKGIFKFNTHFDCMNLHISETENLLIAVA